MPKAEDYWPDFPVILGFGSTHEMRGAPDARRSRLWGLKSTSKAACIAYDAEPQVKARRVGFAHRKPR